MDDDDEEDPLNDDAAEEEPEEDNDNDDEEAAEGEDPVPVRRKPSEVRINQLLFRDICKRLETIWSAKGRTKPDDKKLNLLIPGKMLADLCAHGETVFPLVRLLLPHMDARRYNMGEGRLAEIYATALSLAPSKAKMLYNYADPQFVTKAQGQSDLSSVIKSVVQTHCGKNDAVASDWTIGAVNDMLDQFVRLPVRAKELKDAMQRTQSSPTKRRKPPTLRELRADWLRTLNQDGERKGLSAVEHKWLARILLKKMQFGLLSWLHPHAPMAYTAKNNLRSVCNDFCNPEIRREAASANKSVCTTLVEYLPQSSVVPQFGSIFTPMLSERTGFDRILDDISRRHRVLLKESSKEPYALALQHPAFLIEPKMDGERILVHANRDGIMRMHTRNGNWYSNIYAPALGPPLRRALPKNIDVILDGEVIAWDSHRQETVPFGNNRGIASMRRHYLASRGELDDRDKNVHTDDSEGPFMAMANEKTMDDDQDLAGSECWLQFVVFDIVYLDGEGMAELLRETVSPHLTSFVAPGSLTNLDLFERKKLLYKVLKPQKDEVEIIQAWIVRPNGGTISASEYFDSEHIFKECGHPAFLLDSQTSALSATITGLEALDHERRHNLTDDQISQQRAMSIQHLYDDMVERQRLEGLIFKDMSTPYFLGQESKTLRFWLKFKPDYFNGSVASDLDFAVVGGYFATGLKHGGNGDRADPDEWIHPDDCPVLTLNAGEVVESDTFSAGLSLRFPRVTRVRTGADRKPASDVETEHNVWKIYQEIISSRASSNALTSSSQPMMGSQAESGTESRLIGQACRFLTERQHAEKKRASKRRTGTKEKLNVAMPDQKLKGISSQCLDGLKFAVLGNRFHLDKRSDEYEFAEEQGWSEDALKIKSGQDMKNFIVKHGGTCSVNPDADCDFVVGNFEDDPKVEIHIRAIQNARAASSTARTKKAERNAKLAQSPGVVRWTFVLSLVSRLQKEFGGKRPENTDILSVSVLDYLSRPEGLDADSTLYEIEIPTTYQMQRALDLIGKSMDEKVTMNWAEESIFLPPDGRWVASCGFEPFWPFQKEKAIKPPIVVYPDIFESYGFLSKDEALIAKESDRWEDRVVPEIDSITSLLPLVRIMGAMVTYHFHTGVTHVLSDKVTDIEPGKDYLSRPCHSRSSLAERIRNVQEDSSDSSPVIVSPTWMTQTWERSSSS